MIDRQTELFLKRVANVVVERGLSIEDAMRAVCARDAEIVNDLLANRKQMDAVCSSLAAEVHAEINA